MYTVHAQQSVYFKMKPDSSGYLLTKEGASILAALPLKCILQEYPNKTNHTSNSDSDHVLTPRQLHPTFYGCFDWHSSVHGHWMLVKLLKLYPQLPEAVQVRDMLRKTITPQNIAGEQAYWNLPLTASWERTYGWAWLLKLDEELAGWNDDDGRQWHKALLPLTQKIVTLWSAFLPKQTYANRTGVHPNTAFGMSFALDYARRIGNKVFADSLVAAAKKLFLSDKNAPATWEPNGSDFLSPALHEADLMRRVLPASEFVKWFNAFLPARVLQHLAVLPIVSDRTDLQIVHLDGLCFIVHGVWQVLPMPCPRLIAEKAFYIRQL
jgi:hypothetical protein